ncbi:MAG TPA: hypothetical protein VJ913_01390 [Actinomycetota bacterium]|nr:hypothetical protein [Actinomycetota bacterium]
MAANVEELLPIFDFPVISNDDAPKDPKPGDRWTETVWREDPPPGSWDRGEQIGTVEIQAIGPSGSPRFKADFSFNGIEVEGPVPGGERWQGKGKAKARGPKPDKDVDVEFRNPKRWG